VDKLLQAACGSKSAKRLNIDQFAQAMLELRINNNVGRHVSPRTANAFLGMR
jgi:hypothetical protein